MIWSRPTQPEGWPRALSPPLYLDQAADVLDAWRWSAYHVQPLVLVCCGPCGTPVMAVHLPRAPDPDDPEHFDRVCPHGPLVRGTIKTDDLRLQIAKRTVVSARRMCACWPDVCTIVEHQANGNAPAKHKRIPMDDQWLALLDRVPDTQLPAWCDRDGDLRVDVGELRRRAARVIAGTLPEDTKMTTNVRKPRTVQ